MDFNQSGIKARLGVDTGGTFTDFVLQQQGELRIHKQLSTPEAPEKAILAGIKALGLRPGEFELLHGSTVATNAALERKGVRTAYVTNKGLADVLSLGRQARPQLYNLQQTPELPPVPAELCFEVDCRLAADGQVVTPLSSQAVDKLLSQLQAANVTAVAINLLFSFIDDSHERQLEQAISERLPSVLVCRSSVVLPEYREYERGVATWLNAWLGPLVDGYLHNLEQAVAPSPVAVMQSNGGVLPATQAAKRAVNLLLSGPAGGLKAAQFWAERCQEPAVLTFDMGGTSTDVALVQGAPSLTTEGDINGLPVAVPMVDMHTIGAGGGSIAWIDDGGLLQVGPQSAGASPGPACYGAGGRQATVTDANLLLGRLPANGVLAGAMQLDIENARQACARLAEPLGLEVEALAQGIVDLANEHMAQALRVISVQQGYDPRDAALMAFGGAAGLHACALAEALSMRRVILPAHGGVLSALGMLVSPVRRESSKSLRLPLQQFSVSELLTLAESLLVGLRADFSVNQEPTLLDYLSLDCRYQGQSHTLAVAFDRHSTLQALASRFHELHQQRFGHALNQPIELVTLRVAVEQQPSQPFDLPKLAAAKSVASAQAIELSGFDQPVSLWQRNALVVGQVVMGPALIVEQVSTHFVAARWQAEVDDYANLRLSRLA